ncbi:MAG: relaxase/mobilization nuclease domain-containing protein [Oscillospiraceae bacterium]|nr:relaxase/mobilization nuclease domain-containing protein [Oscillospiraceae bacterium]
MATTRLFSMHVNKGKTVAASIKSRTDYAKNPDKTDGGEFVSSYECDPATVDAQFLLAKKQYLANTGREQKRDVLAYQIRQSFKPGEITPELANQIGYELAMQWTKGSHQFIVATHIDKQHIHNHIVYNSTSLNCTRKFSDFLCSGRAVRRISDRLCLEHGLSIIENPKSGRHGYGKWLGDQKPASWQDKLRSAIDAALAEKPADLDAFLLQMKAAGYEVKQGKNLAFKAKGQQRFSRCRALGDDYSDTAILERIAGKHAAPCRKRQPVKQAAKVSLLVDIQAKLQAGKGAGYERWAKVFNLKQMAKTINYLSENGLLEYSQLADKTVQATSHFNALSSQIKQAESRMAEITALEKQIVNYAKTRETYIAYRKAGYSPKFRAKHEQEIILHQAAKDAFSALNTKKLPTIKVLKAEYDELLIQKKKAYSEYAAAKKEMQEAATAKANVDRLLGAEEQQTGQEQTKEKENSKRQNCCK